MSRVFRNRTVKSRPAPVRMTSAKFGYPAGPASRMRNAPGEFTGRVATTASDGDPRRRVLSGVNLEDPRDLFTIAIIEDADPAEIPLWMERIAPVEERRHERIKHLVSEPTLNAVHQVTGDDDLSRPIAPIPA